MPAVWLAPAPVVSTTGTIACTSVEHTVTLNWKSRLVSLISTPFRYSFTETPTTNWPVLVGVPVSKPVVGSIAMEGEAFIGLEALKGNAHGTLSNVRVVAGS